MDEFDDPDLDAETLAAQWRAMRDGGPMPDQPSYDLLDGSVGADDGYDPLTDDGSAVN